MHEAGGPRLCWPVPLIFTKISQHNAPCEMLNVLQAAVSIQQQLGPMALHGSREDSSMSSLCGSSIS